MRKNRVIGIIFGFILGIFCIGLITASIRIQLVQSKEQSPVYQRQNELKHDAIILAKELNDLANEYPRLDQTRQLNSQMQMFMYDIPAMRNRFFVEGLISTNLDKILDGGIMYGEPAMQRCREASKEINAIAQGLPTNE